MIAAGAAYVYDINQVEFQELRKREPKVLNELPELIIEKDKGMFEEAREFHESMLRVKGYSILTIQVWSSSTQSNCNVVNKYPLAFILNF